MRYEADKVKYHYLLVDFEAEHSSGILSLPLDALGVAN